MRMWSGVSPCGTRNFIEPVFKSIQKSVNRLAARAFKKFPRAGRFADLDDVIQGSLIRLLSTLRAIRPESTRQFYALANTAIRSYVFTREDDDDADGSEDSAFPRSV